MDYNRKPKSMSARSSWQRYKHWEFSLGMRHSSRHPLKSDVISKDGTSPNLQTGQHGVRCNDPPLSNQTSIDNLKIYHVRAVEVATTSCIMPRIGRKGHFYRLTDNMPGCIRQTDGRHRWMEARVDGSTGGWRHRWMEAQLDGGTDGWKDRIGYKSVLRMMSHQLPTWLSGRLHRKHCYHKTTGLHDGFKIASVTSHQQNFERAIHNWRKLFKDSSSDQ